VELALCISKSGGSLTFCGRIRAFGEMLAKDVDQARSIEKANGRKVCSKCAGSANVAKAQRTGAK
jgi:hypothetical protein